MTKHPFQHSPHDQEGDTMPEKRQHKPKSQHDPLGSTPCGISESELKRLKEPLEERPTTVRWISADGSEHTVESADQDEITIRCLVLLLKWQKGEVLKITVEH